ncbi:MAG TPA: hypothetical protein VFS85_02980, partial [Dongiaceae bacterium]|nr:hypothetical protein [Dongiaceae bacterium]
MNSLVSLPATRRVRAIGGIAAATVLGFAFTVPGYAASPPESFADLAAKVSPAVVNVSSTHMMDQQDDQGAGEMPFDFPPGSPFEQFFKQFQ